MNAVRKPKSTKAIEIAKIHIGATKLGLIKPGDKSVYLQMLWSVACVKTSKDLDASGRAKVLAHLRGCGWNDSSPPGTRKPGGNKQAGYIRFLWSGLAAGGHLANTGEPALRAYVEHQSAPYHPQKVGYSAPELLPTGVASRVIEHLKQWCERLKVPTK
jgi:hypothetical protein